MKIFKIVLILFFVARLDVKCYSQQKTKIDSLKHELTITNIDSVRVNILLRLVAEFGLENTDSSFFYSDKALKIINEHNFEKQLASYHFNVGIIYYNKSKLEKSLDHFFKAIKIYQNYNNDDLLSPVYARISYVYGRLGERNLANSYLKKALAIDIKGDSKLEIGQDYNSLAIIYFKYDIDSAEFFLKKAIKIYTEINNKSGLSSSYLTYGNINAIKENYKLSEIYYKKAIEIQKEFGNKRVIAKTYGSLGYMTYIKGKKAKFNKNKTLKQSIKYAKKSIEIAKSNNYLGSLMNSYGTLINAYWDLKDYKNAIEYQTLFMQAKDSIYNIEKVEAIKEMETKYQVSQKDNKIIRLQKEKEKSKFEKILISLIGGLIILSVFIILIRIKQKHKNRINNLEKRRLKIETQMLRSQMNPHFIFNSLNSIQSFISNKETIDAERYLSKFAKLMRLILDNSRKPFITIENEINTLSLYLELEKLRFDNRFNYKININNIDDEFTLIPPMLAQPYIENSILHGVASKKNGQINIDFNQKDNRIICTIDDNGIGRKKSEEIKNQSSYKKISLGIKVTKERIELLKAENNIDLTVSIIDKFDEGNNSTGTKVIIEMPFKE